MLQASSHLRSGCIKGSSPVRPFPATYRLRHKLPGAPACAPSPSFDSAASHQPTACSSSQQPSPTAADKHGPWEAGVHRTQMSVRDYELDQFGVVNNAIYSWYLQHGRHEALCSLGFSIQSFTASGSALALASLSLTYLAPLRSQDLFEVHVWVQKVTGVRAVLGQEIRLLTSGVPDDKKDPRKPGQVVVKAEAVVVWLDDKYAPIRIPVDVREAFVGVQRLRDDNA